MKGSRYRAYSGNFLFALNVFIVFLLLFESYLVVPAWLQPFGRMHPLVLHFPIVLLLLSMVLEFFRFKTQYQSQDFFQHFTSNLLLVGVITSGITVMMGLFLSLEEGYQSAALGWHKWTGVSVFFLASLIYTARNASWYRAAAAKGAAVATTLCLILAGHFGATLTHGDNFIWQPVLASEQVAVPLEEAVLFDHVIMPVLQNKCVGCHNPDKLKGKLIMTDSASLLKGGKNGALFVAGDPEGSLMLKRIHLPEDDKKHMPPAGKPQLTGEEVALLSLWIKEGAPFKTKVMELPVRDSLRLMASAILKESQPAEVFEFASADEETIRKLNTNYRVVVPIAQESPALSVNVFNSAAYAPNTLDQLKDVKQQIISLDLTRMPVGDDDLRNVARFENLRRLNLNFTAVTGKGLPELSKLRDLRSLSLAGTAVEYDDLVRHLPAFKALHSVALWHASISDKEIEDLRKAIPHLRILSGPADLDERLIKLNPPRLKNATVVFEDTLALKLFHPINGVELRFTMDGSEPDSLNATLFSGNTVLDRSTAIRAKAYKQGWLSSDAVTLNLYRSSIKPDSVILLEPLNKVHQANGPTSFFDHQLGTFNANSPAWANNWAGVINRDMSMLLRFDTPRTVSSVSLNMLVETETFIFPPSSIEVWGGDSEHNLTRIAVTKPAMPVAYSKPFIRLENCTFAPHEISYLKIVARPVMKLPGWHKRKDRPALLLVDEILIN